MGVDKNIAKSQSGFTIIEVALVLAIAGLIFAVVFIAVPALQASQRDNHRKNDVALTVAAVKNYMTNNDGDTPPDSGESSTGKYVDLNGDGVVSADEKNLDWQTGNASEALKPYLTGVLNDSVTTTVAVHDVTSASTLYVTAGNADKAGLITVYLGAQCPTTYPRPNVLTVKLTHNKTDVAVFRYLEGGGNFCEDF